MEADLPGARWASGTRAVPAPSLGPGGGNARRPSARSWRECLAEVGPHGRPNRYLFVGLIFAEVRFAARLGPDPRPRKGAVVRKRPGTGSAKGSPAPRRTHGGPPTIGVDIGGTTTSVAVVGASGGILASERRATRPERGPRVVTDEIASMIRDLSDTSSFPPPVAVGIGVAAQVDGAGQVVASPNLRWASVPLGRWMTQRTHLPVAVTNDVRAATFGEWHFGAGRGARDMVCVFVGTGVGGGIVADGRLRFGASLTAGEIGHMIIVHGGRRCHCPGRGCLEAYVGGWAIGARAREAARREPQRATGLLRLAGHLRRITARTVTGAAARGDPLASELLRETVDYLASGIVGIINVVNPGVIVLGGGVVEGLPGLLPTLRTRVANRALAAAVRDVRLVRARLGGDAGVIGAAGMAQAGVPWAK
ncbi:MAG: ROK family protein [Thermoplasmata archaeon]